MSIACPAQAGRQGRAEGRRQYRPWRSHLEAGREALHFHRIPVASEPTRQVFLFAYYQGWLAAAAEAAQKAKEQS